MNDISITKRFQLLLAGLSAMGVIIIALGTYSVVALDRAMTTLDKAVRLNEHAVNSQLEAKKMESFMRGYLLNPADATLLEKKKIADEANAKLIEEMKLLTTDSALKRIFEDQSAFDDKELNPREEKLASLIANEKTDEARTMYIRDVMPVQAKYEKIGEELANKTDTAAEQTITSARAEINRLVWALVILVAIGTAILTALVFWSSKSIVNALNRLVTILSSGADEVASASTEISSTAVELSSAATEQASSIQETASSIEEVNAMVKKNAENAEKSGSIAQRGQNTANKGKEVVQEMLSAMTEINGANVQIMKQIEQSNAEIADIVRVIAEIGNKTKVINDIVFQTKLLSFNASVEAARAGEHGKGFAVVAEEVGNLAQMSGNAAKEISALLEGSIQKVERIVSNTQTRVEQLVSQGKTKVDAGTAVARRTHEVLGEIVDSVAEVVNMVGEISTASHEQAQGVQEITKAVAQLDQVTQQNAAASNQSASAAEALSRQAEALRAAVRDLVKLVGTNDAQVTTNTSPAAKKSASLPTVTSKLALKKETTGLPAQEVPLENDLRFKEI